MAAPKVDILVNLLTALQPDPSTTTVPLNDADQALDYSRLIGTKVVDHENKLSQLTSSLNTLYGYVTTLQNQMATILANGLTVPQISLPVIMGDSAFYNVEVVVSAIGSQLNVLRTATGDSNALTAAVGYQNKIYSETEQKLEDQVSLSTPSSIMSELRDWVDIPATAADAIKNMWITINDMRKAVQASYSESPITCDSITIGFSLYRDIPNNRITLFFVGATSIPDGFIDKDATGASLRISDGSSTVYTTYVNVSQASKNVSGVTIDLTGTGINLYTNLTLVLTYSLTNGSLVCSGTYTPAAFTTTATPCTPLLLTATSTTSFSGSFTPILYGTNVAYSISTYTNEACTSGYLVIGSTRTYTNIGQSQIIYAINSGLTIGNTYYVKMTTTNGSPTATFSCQPQSITLPST